MNQFFKNKLLVFTFLCCAIVLWSCKENTKKNESTHTSGTLKLLADDTFRPLLGTTLETFETIYPDARIKLEYLPQEKAFLELLKGSTNVIIAGRALSKAEEEKVRSKGLRPKVNKIASDALTFIVAKNNPDTLISEDKIAEILSGKLKVQLVCDKSNSGNLLYLKNRFQLSEIRNIAAAGTDSAVIEYVTTHPTAIGIIGMALVSDYDDKKVRERLSRVNLLSVQYKDSTGKVKEGYPVQEELANGKYPFIRDIFVINLDGNRNLGTGFANFLVSERGQRIVLKSGLIPFRWPGREILIINKEP